MTKGTIHDCYEGVSILGFRLRDSGSCVRVSIPALANDKVDHLLEVVGSTQGPESRPCALERVADLGVFIKLQAEEAFQRGVPFDVAQELVFVARVQVLIIRKSYARGG